MATPEEQDTAPDLVSGPDPQPETAAQSIQPAPQPTITPPAQANVSHQTSPTATTSYVNMDQVGRDVENGKDGLMNDDVSVTPSVLSSVMTADGIHDVPGFICICFVILIGDMSRGIFFPSLFMFVEHLGGSSVTLGVAVAAFSFGRILVNPVFGSWSHTLGYTRTLLISCSILFVGTLMYAATYMVGRTEFLILSQTMMGVGSGTLGVTRAFVADVTARRNRTTYMAWATAVQYGGFTVTPIIGAFFNYLFEDEVGYLNKFTAPALFMALVVLSTILALVIFFQGRGRIVTTKDSKANEKKSLRRQEIERVANEIIPVIGLSVYDCCLFGCLLLNISTKGSIASYETLGMKIAQSHFHMLSQRAGLYVGFCGSIGVTSLLSMGHLSKWFTDVQLIAGGMMVMTCSTLLFTTLEENENVYLENPSWKYCVSIFLMYSVGYPIGHTAVIGLFSKVIGRRPQGTLQGWFASAGSLARILFPLMSGVIEHYGNVELLFGIIACVLVVSTAFIIQGRETLTLLSQ